MKKLLAVISVVGLILLGSSLASAGELWGTGSPGGNWSDDSGPSPVIFKFNTSTGVISTTFSFEDYNIAVRCEPRSHRQSGYPSTDNGYIDLHGTYRTCLHGHVRAGPSTLRCTYDRNDLLH